ncbi:MAG: hypothetical protein NTU44_10595, partial [Bacteroidetes bacterium]|nr:hypothetical protein [Bacteroidota bacterium]
GHRSVYGGTGGFQQIADFWTSTEQTAAYAWLKGLDYNYDWMWQGSIMKGMGYALRCLKNNCNQLPAASNAGPDQVLIGSYTTLDGNLSGSDYDYGMWSIATGTGGFLDEPWYNHCGFYGIAGNTYKLVWTLFNDCSSSSDTVEIRFTVPFLICGDSINYDGQEYQIVKIGNQCWMKENLNIGTMIASTTAETDNGIIEKYCYDNDPVHCTEYGGLYGWDEVMQYTTTVGTQGICPQGFHLPSMVDVGVMFVNLGGNVMVGPSEKVKEAGNAHWASPNYGTNESGFSAIGAGFEISTVGWFGDLTNSTAFWTSEVWVDPEYANAFIVRQDYRPADVFLNPEHRYLGYSVRCIKDPCDLIPNQAIAGPDQTISEGSTTLAGNYPQPGTGVWSIISGDGGVIMEPSNPQSQFNGVQGNSYQLVWTISTACSSTNDTVVITIIP